MSRYHRAQRSIGDAGDDSTVDFNAEMSSLIDELQSDYDTAKKVYDAANATLQALQADTKKQWQTVQAGIETFATILGTAAGAPWASALFNAWFSQQPGAGAGPGVCSQDPPASPDWPTLKTWSHYMGWDPISGSPEPHPTPGTFDAWAMPQLEYNFVLLNNCYDQLAQPPEQLLAHLIATWNATHAGPAVTYKVTGINPDCPIVGSGTNRHFDCSHAPINRWDPIAAALSAQFTAMHPCGFGQNCNVPSNVTMTYTVNTGPELKKVANIRIRLHGNAPAASSPAAAAAPVTIPAAAPMTPGAKAATVAVVGLAGAAGAYFYLRGVPSFLAKLLR